MSVMNCFYTLDIIPKQQTVKGNFTIILKIQLSRAKHGHARAFKCSIQYRMKHQRCEPSALLNTLAITCVCVCVYVSDILMFTLYRGSGSDGY